MHVSSIRTGKILPGASLTELLDAHLPPLAEGSILAIASKAVAIAEGRVVPVEGSDKKDLVEREADYILESGSGVPRRHSLNITAKDGVLIANGGVDESNGNGSYVLWPQDPQKTANDLRAYLKKRFGLKDAGAIIVDSKNQVLRRGIVGTAIAHSGFKALRGYAGTLDVFGRTLQGMNAKSILEGLAVAASLTMGEGNEQTPIAVIDDVPFVEFQTRNPSKKDLAELHIEMKDDLFAPILLAAKWRKGGSGRAEEK